MPKQAIDLHKSQKGLPLETKNTQNRENRRLGLIESLHMQHCSLWGCIRPLAPTLAVFDFQNYQDGLNDPPPKKYITCTMMMSGETFYGRHTAQHQLK